MKLAFDRVMQRICTARDVLCSLPVWSPSPFGIYCVPVSITGSQAVPADPGFTQQFYHSVGHVGGHVLFQPNSRFDGRFITYTLSKRVVVNVSV